MYGPITHSEMIELIGNQKSAVLARFTYHKNWFFAQKNRSFLTWSRTGAPIRERFVMSACVRASNICSRSGPSQCLGNCDTPRTMSLLDTIVPVVADNTYNGHPAVIWYVRNPNLTYLTYAIRITDTIDSRILWLVTAYNIWRSLTHWLKYDGGAQSIGRIPLDTGSSFIFHWNTTLRDPNSAVIFTILIT